MLTAKIKFSLKFLISFKIGDLNITWLEFAQNNQSSSFSYITLTFKIFYALLLKPCINKCFTLNASAYNQCFCSIIPGHLCLVCLQNTAFENTLVNDQNQMQKYKKQEEEMKKEVHLSSSELCLHPISVFAPNFSVYR